MLALQAIFMSYETFIYIAFFFIQKLQETKVIQAMKIERLDARHTSPVFICWRNLSSNSLHNSKAMARMPSDDWTNDSPNLTNSSLTSCERPSSLTKKLRDHFCNKKTAADKIESISDNRPDMHCFLVTYKHWAKSMFLHHQPSISPQI